jgi:integrase
MRNKLANDLKDPSIHTIRLYDFRHYFCSKQLNDTKDPYFVMIQMGHKKLETTQNTEIHAPNEPRARAKNALCIDYSNSCKRKRTGRLPDFRTRLKLIARA